MNTENSSVLSNHSRTTSTSSTNGGGGGAANSLKKPRLKSRSKQHECSICHDHFERSYQLKRHRFVAHNKTDLYDNHHQNKASVKSPVEQTKNNNQIHPACDGGGCKKLDIVQQHLQNYSCISLVPSSLSPPNNNNTTVIDKQPIAIEDNKKYFDPITGLEWNQIIYDVHNSYDTILLKCAVCNENFDNLKLVDQHMIEHNGEPFRHQCQLCDDWMSQRSHLIKHVIGHTKTFRYKCPYCQLSVATEQQLLVHTSTLVDRMPKCCVDPITGRLHYQCLSCCRTFVNKHLYDSHRFFEHEGKKPYECDVCRQRFIHLAVLLKHQEYDTDCDYPN